MFGMKPPELQNTQDPLLEADPSVSTADPNGNFLSRIRAKLANAGLAGQANPAGKMDMNQMMQMMMMMQQLMQSPGKNAGPEEWLAKLGPALMMNNMGRGQRINPATGVPASPPVAPPMPQPGVLPPDLTGQSIIQQLQNAYN